MNEYIIGFILLLIMIVIAVIAYNLGRRNGYESGFKTGRKVLTRRSFNRPYMHFNKTTGRFSKTEKPIYINGRNKPKNNVFKNIH